MVNLMAYYLDGETVERELAGVRMRGVCSQSPNACRKLHFNNKEFTPTTYHNKYI